MSAANDILDRLAEIGAKIEAAGNRLIVRAGPKSVPSELVQRLRDAKAEVIAILDEAAQWQARYREAVVRWGALHPPAEAAGLAWGEMENRWHRQFGERAPPDLCAGCRRPIGGVEALAMIDGNACISPLSIASYALASAGAAPRRPRSSHWD
jgi:hypothetical protein